MKYLWLLLLFPVGYFGMILLKAWAEVKSTPREEMFWCEKHGPIPFAGTIEFVGVRSCGTCFHQKMKTAERVM